MRLRVGVHSDRLLREYFRQPARIPADRRRNHLDGGQDTGTGQRGQQPQRRPERRDVRLHVSVHRRRLLHRHRLESTKDSCWTGAGTTWTATEAPLPANAASYPYAALSAVACASASACTAVGTYDTSGSQQGLLLTGSGSTWTAAEAPVPANAASNPSAYLYGLACPAISACTAIGSYTDSAGDGQGLLLTGSGSTWTAAEAPVPSNAASNPSAYLYGLACPAISACTAFGSYIDTSGNQPPFLVTESGSTWTAIEPPVPANAASNPSAAVSGLACPAASQCAIAAQYDSAPGNQRASLVTESEGSWTAAEAPLPANANLLGVSLLVGMACPSTVMCVAAGNYDDTFPSLQAFILIGTGN